MRHMSMESLFGMARAPVYGACCVSSSSADAADMSLPLPRCSATGSGGATGSSS